MNMLRSCCGVMWCTNFHTITKRFLICQTIACPRWSDARSGPPLEDGRPIRFGSRSCLNCKQILVLTCAHFFVPPFFFFPIASFISHANPNTILFLKEGIGGNFGLSAWTHPVCAEATHCHGPSFRDPYVYSRNVGWPYVKKELQKTV